MRYGRIREYTHVNNAVYWRFSENTTGLRYVFQCIRYPYFTVYVSQKYDRNTGHMKRVIYGAFTVVIIPFTNVYISVNARIRSFTIVVIVDLGISNRSS